jgi:hypothetical protein
MSGHPQAAILAAAMLVAMGACSTTRHVGSAFSPEAVSQIRAHEGWVPIELLEPKAPGAKRPVDRVVKVMPDATVVRRPDGSDLTIRNEAIRSVRAHNRIMGAGEGMRVGFAAGAASGALLGYGIQNGDFIPHGEAMAIGGVLLGAVGASLGALLGALAGHTTTYVFDDGR